MVDFTALLLACLISVVVTAENFASSSWNMKSNTTGIQKDAIGKAYSGHYGGYQQPPPPSLPLAYGAYSNNAPLPLAPPPPPAYAIALSYSNNMPYPSHPQPTYDTYGGGVHDHYGPQPFYPQPSQQQSYGNYPIYGPSYHRNYQQDTYYCSVHGSFALAYTQKDNRYDSGTYGKSADGHGGKGTYGNDSGNGKQGGENSYSGSSHNNGGGYGNKGGYSDQGKGYSTQQSYYKPRVYARQYCRYAASASERACQFCCRVVARSSNTSPTNTSTPVGTMFGKKANDDIVSAIFAFDPLNPSAYSAGYEDGNKSGNEKKDDNNSGSKKLFQCVCCAPKDNSGY